jgi:hypothetical protein
LLAACVALIEVILDTIGVQVMRRHSAMLGHARPCSARFAAAKGLLGKCSVHFLKLCAERLVIFPAPRALKL